MNKKRETMSEMIETDGNDKEAQWSTIRVLWESGKYKSVAELARYCQTVIKNAPAAETIRRRAHRELWEKGLLEEKILEEKRKGCAELFAEIGMPRIKRIEYLGRIIKAPFIVLDEIEAAIKKFSEGSQDKGAIIELQNGLRALLMTFSQGARVSTTAIDMSFKLEGEYKAEKKKIEIHDRTPKANLGRNVSDMTDDEIEQELARIRSRMSVN